jgi:hypothetical protein
MLKSALLVTAGIVVGAGAISVLHAQNNAPTISWPKSTSKTKKRTRPVVLIRSVMA